MVMLFNLTKSGRATMNDLVVYRSIFAFLAFFCLSAWKPAISTDYYAKTMLNSYIKIGGAGGFKALKNYLEQSNSVTFELLKLPKTASQADLDWFKGLYDQQSRDRLVPELRKVSQSSQNQEIINIYSEHICKLETLYDRVSKTGACTMQQEQEEREYRVTWVLRVLDILCVLVALVFHLKIRKQNTNNKLGTNDE